MKTRTTITLDEEVLKLLKYYKLESSGKIRGINSIIECLVFESLGTLPIYKVIEHQEKNKNKVTFKQDNLKNDFKEENKKIQKARANISDSDFDLF